MAGRAALENAMNPATADAFARAWIEGPAMMTRELLLREMARSETDEERIYKELTLGLFRELQEPLKRLYDEGFFNGSQRTISAIVSHGDSNLATKVKQSDLSGTLALYTRHGKLRRSKNAEGQYEYIKA